MLHTVSERPQATAVESLGFELEYEFLACKAQ